jgi:hypothetical protein
MSRKLALLAAAFAFSAIIGAGSLAHAQAQSDMIPPGGSLPGGSTMGSRAQMGGSAMSGGASASAGAPMRGTSAGAGAPMRGASMGTGRSMRRHHAMRGNRGMRAERRQMRADRRAAQNPDAAYMGGGAVYERTADGSLRPVM